MKIQTDKKLSKRLNGLIQQAVDKAIERHRQRGESIAISDEEGKVKIIPAEEIPKYQKLNKINKN
ncbi:hypothetical protein [Myxosarcina sp. GI1]|uniref:hypothetical protein n=1 Tax=Myxosarcina sp. GI1 TaxID=1541065 RepID=UPI0005676840|nr:hypothetical protein [Myxosarcina sp. GI1]